MPIQPDLNALFRPASVAFVGGTNLTPALRYHRELGFAGQTWVVNPTYTTIEGFDCTPTIEALPAAPDLAFVAIRRERAVDAIESLRIRGCKALVCHAAGFAETGAAGADLQTRLLQAIGPMAALGPNSVGLVNFADPMAAIMDHFGIMYAERGVAIVSQGGGLLCDAVFSDRGLPITHLVGCGNQAVIGIETCAEYLLDDPRVCALGLSFEGIRDVAGLRRAASKALRLGKAIVALKFGNTAAGARAAQSHTASMAGTAKAWEALFDRLGIVSVASESEFFETLKLFATGQMPNGRRVLVTAASGVLGVMLADHLSRAGFDLPQPSPDRIQRLRALLPGIATPGNPQDITMGAWNDMPRQEAIYATLLDEGYDIALMIQNYPRVGTWDVTEWAAQVAALAAACRGHDVVAAQIAPLVDCFPAEAQQQTRSLGLVPMQGLDESIASLAHTLWWQERASVLRAAQTDLQVDAALSGAGDTERLDEAAAKVLLRKAGISVPTLCVTTPADAAAAASTIGFPVVLKALDARLLHKTEAGAVRIGLADGDDVVRAVTAMRSAMRRNVPHIPLRRVLLESMATDVVVEMLASVSHDPCVGAVMLIAGGGIEAELWNDSTLLAAPFTRDEIARALDRLKVAQILHGWRGRPAGDREALLDTLEALARFAFDNVTVEVEINPLLVGVKGVVAVDAVLHRKQRFVAAAHSGGTGDA